MEWRFDGLCCFLSVFFKTVWVFGSSSITSRLLERPFNYS